MVLRGGFDVDFGQFLITAGNFTKYGFSGDFILNHAFAKTQDLGFLGGIGLES